MKTLSPRLLDAAGLSDGDYTLRVVGGKVTALALAPTGTDATTTLVPLTTTVNGIPELVWESDDALSLTEVPL